MPVSNEYLLTKISVDTAENAPLKVHLFFQPWDLIFTEPPCPRGAHGEVQRQGADRRGLPALRALRRRAPVLPDGLRALPLRVRGERRAQALPFRRNLVEAEQPGGVRRARRPRRNHGGDDHFPDNISRCAGK